MKETDKLKFNKPEINDFINIAVLNENMDALDGLVSEKADKVYVDSKVKTDVPYDAKFTDTVTDISGKVDKVYGMGLSSNNYTDADKKKLNEGAADSVSKAYVDNRVKTPVPRYANFNDTIVDISGKVDKEWGKGLSTNDFTNSDKSNAGRIGNHISTDGSKTTKGHLRVGDGLLVSRGVISSPLDVRSDGTVLSFAVGLGASASGINAIALGELSRASANFTIALGRNAVSSGRFGTSLGHNASALGSSSTALGDHAVAENMDDVAIGGATHTDVIINGNLSVKGTKNFEMPHPKPSKSATHVIRHGAVESASAGDTLYRYTITSTKANDMQAIELPDYFIHLNNDVQVFVTPQEHFKNGYGKLNRQKEQLEIHCEAKGEYNVLVIGTRNDNHQSVQNWNIKGVEREIGESWTGETYAFSVEEIIEVSEINEGEL